MLISTQTSELTRRLGYLEAVRMIAAAGFDCYDLSMGSSMRDNDDDPFNSRDWVGYANKIRTTAEEVGIRCNQAHAPFHANIGNGTAWDKLMRERIRRSIRVAAAVGAENIVIHPLKYDNDTERMFDESVTFFSSLVPLCETCDIRIAVENISVTRDADTLCRMIDAVGSPMVVACMDVGHAAFLGQDIPEMVKTLGFHLKALHVHDNDLKSDLHTLPFLGKIDFSSFIKALTEINYTGELTFEADNFLKGIPTPLLMNALDYMSKVGHYLCTLA